MKWARVLITQPGPRSKSLGQRTAFHRTFALLVDFTYQSDRFERQDGALQLLVLQARPLVARAGERRLA